MTLQYSSSSGGQKYLFNITNVGVPIVISPSWIARHSPCCSTKLDKTKLDLNSKQEHSVDIVRSDRISSFYIVRNQTLVKLSLCTFNTYNTYNTYNSYNSFKTFNTFNIFITFNTANTTNRANIVKLREREGRRVDLGRSLKSHLQMVDGGWWMSFP